MDVGFVWPIHVHVYRSPQEAVECPSSFIQMRTVKSGICWRNDSSMDVGCLYGSHVGPRHCCSEYPWAHGAVEYPSRVSSQHLLTAISIICPRNDSSLDVRCLYGSYCGHVPSILGGTCNTHEHRVAWIWNAFRATIQTKDCLTHDVSEICHLYGHCGYYMVHNCASSIVRLNDHHIEGHGLSL